MTLVRHGRHLALNVVDRSVDYVVDHSVDHRVPCPLFVNCSTPLGESGDLGTLFPGLRHEECQDCSDLPFCHPETCHL